MAFTFEIVTHGGFDLVRDVWVFVASIFGSSLYRGLLTAVFLLSLTLAAAGGFLEGLLGGRLTSVGSWVRGFFIAIFFYYTFMTGNASVQIYDDVSGQTHLQSGIPVGIAMMAGLANKVAIGLEDMISSFITTPVALSDIGYERGIKMLQESYDGVMKTALATQVAPQAWDSANYYVSDCVAIEAVRSTAYRAQIDQNTDVLSAWVLAAHPVLYTYTGLDADGNPLTSTVPKKNVSCAEAWKRLNAYFSSTDWDNVVDKFCNMMSFDASDPASLAACKTVYENTVKEFVLGGTAKAAEDIAKNLFAGKVWNNFLSYLDNSIEAARAAAYARVSSELSGIGIMAQEWIPVIKVMIFVLIVGMLPLVMIFMVTPYAIDAFKFMAGLFCWWVLWCGLDHMMMLWWLNKLYPIFEAVSDGGKLGATGVTQLWTLASKSLALLGNLRSFGMLIASAMMFAVVKFGGSAIAHLTMALGARAVRGTGAQTAANYITPEERAWEQTMQRVAAYNRELMAARMAAEHYGGIDGYYGAKAKADVAGEVAGIEGYRKLESSLGPGTYNVGRALGEGQAGAAYKNVAQGRAALMQSLQGLTNYYDLKLGENVLTAGEIRRQAQEQGFSSLHDFLSAVASAKAGSQVADAVRWDQMKNWSGASSADLAGWLSGKTSPSLGIERRLSEWSGLPSNVFSDLKLKDFAWDTEKGAPALLTFGGSLDNQDLKYLADVLDARGLSNTAEGLREIAGKYGSADVALTLGPDGKLAHLNVNAGSEARSYDLYHDKDLTSLERFRRGDVALSAETEEGRKIIRGLRDSAKAKGWDNAVKFLENLLAHPEKAAVLRWTTDDKGNLSTLEMKEGSEWKRLDTGLDDRSTGVRGKYTTVEDTVDAGTLEGRRKLEKLIDDARKNPKLKNVVNKLGEALVWGDSFKYRAVYDGSGNLTNIQVEQGGTFRDLDRVDMDHTARGTYLVRMDDGNGKAHYELMEGTLAYNEALGQWEVVSGNVAYGLHGRVIRALPPDPETGRPGGLVFADVQWDPKTGKIVSGKESSVLVKEGEIKAGGLKMHGYEAYDTRTGTRLFLDARSGKYYHYTPYGEQWVEHRGWRGEGSYLLSALHKGVEILGGEKAARVVTQVAADTAKGADEIGKAIQVVDKIKGASSKQTPTPKYQTNTSISESSQILGPDGKPASRYSGLKSSPKSKIIYH